MKIVLFLNYVLVAALTFAAIAKTNGYATDLMFFPILGIYPLIVAIAWLYIESRCSDLNLYIIGICIFFADVFCGKDNDILMTASYFLPPLLAFYFTYILHQRCYRNDMFTLWLDKILKS